MHAPAFGNRLHHRAGVVHLHANDLDLWTHGFDVVGHPRNQSAAPDGDEHRVQALQIQTLELAQHFHRNGALTCNHVGVVKRVDKGHARLFLQREGVLVGVRVAVPMQHHLAPQGLHGFDLHPRGGHRHDDHGLGSQAARAQRDTLRMVARRGANHPTLELLRGEMRHFVVGAA